MLAAPFFPELVAKRSAASNDPAAADGNADQCALQPLSAFALYTGGEPVYAWMHSPEHADRGKNFNVAMRGMSRTEGIAFLPLGSCPAQGLAAADTPDPFPFAQITHSAHSPRTHSSSTSGVGSARCRRSSSHLFHICASSFKTSNQ